jgi:bifunctional non-homologous end joining protein LigD
MPADVAGIDALSCPPMRQSAARLSWRMMTEAAQLAKVLLDEIGLKSFIKTSGGKGYHIVIPVTRRQGWDEVKGFSKAVAQHMARVMPDRFSTVLGPKNRVDKIFIDYLRNGKGASTVAAFSAGTVRHGGLDADRLG